jgi:hypothetical protein
MQLVNMKATPAQQKTYGGVEAPVPDAPEYPYGLALHLDQDSLKKLGVKVDPAMVKQEVGLHAKGYIKRVEKSADEQETRVFVDIQITDLAVETGPGQPAAEDRLYGPDKEVKEGAKIPFGD